MKRTLFLFLLLFFPSVPAVAGGLDLMFVDLADYDRSVVLNIHYASTNNFSGTKLYPAERCLLRRDAAMRLLKVQAKLRKMGYRLVVFDCYRPVSLQKRFRALLPDQRDPANGSRHNRGTAVAVWLADSSGRALPMPTAYGDFSAKAKRSWNGVSPEAHKYSLMLESVMKEEGFVPFADAWWHYDLADWERYPVSDFPLEKSGGCEE